MHGYILISIIIGGVFVSYGFYAESTLISASAVTTVGKEKEGREGDGLIHISQTMFLHICRGIDGGGGE